MRGHFESDRPKTLALAAGFAVVRGTAATSATSGWLAVSILRHDVEFRSAPQGITQSSGRRFREELDHALRGVPRQSTSLKTHEKQKGLDHKQTVVIEALCLLVN